MTKPCLDRPAPTRMLVHAQAAPLFSHEINLTIEEEEQMREGSTILSCLRERKEKKNHSLLKRSHFDMLEDMGLMLLLLDHRG